jgi:soluble lytic murein transglycosylase
MDDLARRHGLPVAPLGAEELLTQAQRLLDATELTAGVRVLESIFPLQPEPAVRERALLRLAPALGRLSRGTEGIERLTAALTDLPTAARSSLLLEIGRLQVRGGQTAAGTATFERLVAEHGDTPTAPEAWLALARARADLGQTDGARQAYRTLLTVHEQAAVAGPARWELAWLDYRDGRLRDAALGFRQLSAVGTSNRLAGLYWAGRSLEALGERGAATALFREVHSRGPHTYYGPLAERRLPRGKPPPPVAPALRLPADPLAFLEREVRFQKARALTQVGLDGYAVLELETLGRDAGLDSERAWSLGAAFAQLGEAGRSLRYLRRSFGPAADGGAPGLPPLFWRLYYPLGFADLVQDAARRAGLDPHLVAAVIREESSYDPRARSWVGAVGLMQLMPDTGRLLSTQVGVPLVDPLGLWDPLVNITLGAHYLAQLRSRFGEPLLAVAGYNAGPHRVQRWIERRPPVDLEEFIDQIPFEETRAFVKRVSASWHHYRRLYGSTASEPRRGAMASPRPPR